MRRMISFFQKNSQPDQPNIYDENFEEVILNQKFETVPLREMVPRDINQTMLRGTKIRFSEHMGYNLSLLAQRFPEDQDLVFQQFYVGTRSKRKVIVGYLKDVANPEIVSDVKSRIKDIQTESLMDTSYLERNIENSNMSPFPQAETTIQPDIVESALLQGRIVLFVDHCPDALLVPTTFFDLMDIPQDAYMRWSFTATFFRFARYIMFILAASLPGFYIALTSFNPELLPTNFAFLIAGSTEGNPFPIYFEAFIMMGIVEAIRMIILRLPSQLGTTIALFTGVVLVMAALSANLVGAPIIIVVTLTTITSFGIPNFDLRTSIRMIQFFTMIMTSLLGIFGYAVSFFYIAVHLVTLKSFGIPYMAPLAPFEGSGFSHTMMRDNTKVMPQDETYKPQVKNQAEEKSEKDE